MVGDELLEGARRPAEEARLSGTAAGPAVVLPSPWDVWWACYRAALPLAALANAAASDVISSRYTRPPSRSGARAANCPITPAIRTCANGARPGQCTS
jgi:hypothetical protein